MIELRCGGTMHAKLNIVDGKLEVKCGRRSCGAKRGIVVLHTFDLTSGNMVGTKRFADPVRDEEHHAHNAG
jgi:hypothetical protein